MKNLLLILLMILTSKSYAQTNELTTKYVSFDSVHYYRPTKWVISLDKNYVIEFKNGFINYTIVKQNYINGIFDIDIYNPITETIFKAKFNRKIDYVFLIDFSDNTEYCFYNYFKT